jgi:hypothetical protein
MLYNNPARLEIVMAVLTLFRGVANTYGAFQTFYEAELLSDHSPSQISWIGSIQTFLLMFVGGLATGPIYDAGYLRGLVIVGSVAGVFGLMMTSLCTQYWQLVLAQGICIGIGSGCLMLPSVAVMPQVRYELILLVLYEEHPLTSQVFHGSSSFSNWYCRVRK